MRLIAFLALLTCFGGQAWAWGEGDQENQVPIATIILEAQGEPFNGQVAVGEVIRNRVSKRWSTPRRVCLAPKQFSCWNQTAWFEERLRLVSKSVHEVAIDAWAKSATSDLTHGATHYFNPRLAKPSWARKMVKTVTIGSHEFYREGV